jgi:hypothetical protein
LVIKLKELGIERIALRGGEEQGRGVLGARGEDISSKDYDYD